MKQKGYAQIKIAEVIKNTKAEQVECYAGMVINGAEHTVLIWHNANTSNGKSTKLKK